MTTVTAPPGPIEVHHLTRVEGHGNIVVDIRDGAILQCDLEVVEAPRFFEAMLRGRSYDQAPRLSSRICGICAVTHSTASIRALENALGVVSSLQTTLLRQLNLCGEMLDSHILHAYMLVAPDLFGVGSVFPLAASNPDIVGRALRMKQVAGEICAVVAGRHTHPIAMSVGGFTHLPSEEELQELLHRLEQMSADIEHTVDLYAGLTMPDFERETEYIALHKDGQYPLLDGLIASSDGGFWPIEQYKGVVNEFQSVHSTAKHARHSRQSYMVGALARYNLSHANLHPRARAVASRLGLRGMCHNPYMITVAQVVEIVHYYEEAIRLIGQLLDRGMQDEGLVPPARLSGEGVGACEAPRGTLYHHYVVKNGAISEANCVIPTAQNLANIEADMRVLAPRIWDQPREEATLLLEMLARAYDPCISCSTHMVEVKFP